MPYFSQGRAPAVLVMMLRLLELITWGEKHLVRHLFSIKTGV